MIKRNIFTQETPVTSWVVSIEEPDAYMGRALAAYDESGNSIAWDSWDFQDGKLHVNFGIDPVAGKLAYEYQLPHVEVSQGSPLVSIMTNYGEIKVSPEAIA